MSWNWQKEGRPFDKAADDFIKRCKLDDASITLLSGIPENVKDEVISSCRSDWEEGLSFDRIFKIVRDIWTSQLSLKPRSRLMRLIETAPQDALRVVMMKFDPTRSKDGNVEARLQSFLQSVIRTSQHEQGQPYRATIPNCSIQEKDVGRALGENGSTMKDVLQIVCTSLGHDDRKHGHRPIVQMAYSNGHAQFELTLYPPFNNRSSFEDASNAVRAVVNDINDDPLAFAAKSNCKMPPRLQLDDWLCPSRDCRNVCFARRKRCPKCGESKPAEWTPAHLANDYKIGDVTWKQKKPRVLPMREVLKEQELEPGSCRLVWLLPLDQRWRLLGRKGQTIQEIRDGAGLQNITLTRETETDHYFGEEYLLAFVAGTPESTKKALVEINSWCGGRLAEDGFEQLLDAVEAALQSRPGGLTFQSLTGLPEIRDAMASTQLLRRGAGLRTLLEALVQWPEYFNIEMTGPEGAKVATTGRRSEPQGAEVAAEAGDAEIE